MKIIFNNKEYTNDSLDQLANDAPFFLDGISFIYQWNLKNQFFEFQTSGSTGNPKKIRIKREQIIESVKATATAIGLAPTDRALLCLNPNYVAAKMMLARCLVLNLDLVVCAATSNPFIDQNIPQVDFASFVPFQVSEILSSGRQDQLSKIKNILIGGGPISEKLGSQLKGMANHIYHTYGMTETVSHVALKKLSQYSDSQKFTCLPNVKVSLSDDGCLVVSGPMTDYQSIETNDLVEIHSENKFTWIGRKDNVINSGGVKVIPELIEKLLIPIFRDNNLNNDFFISALNNEKLGQEVVLIIEGGRLTKAVEEMVNSNIEQEFGKYHVPRSIIYVEEMLRTESGKIKRKESVDLALT